MTVSHLIAYNNGIIMLVMFFVMFERASQTWYKFYSRKQVHLIQGHIFLNKINVYMYES